MSIYDFSSNDLGSVLKDLENRVTYLQKGRNISNQTTLALGGDTLISQGSKYYNCTINGTQLRVFGKCKIAAGQTVTCKYRQSVPRIYTDAQLAAGDYLLLGSPATIGATVGTFDVSVSIPDTIRGTYGTIEIQFAPYTFVSSDYRLNYVGLIS